MPSPRRRRYRRNYVGKLDLYAPLLAVAACAWHRVTRRRGGREAALIDPAGTGGGRARHAGRG